MPKSDQCNPNPCGLGAKCDSDRVPPCYCPEHTVGNPYQSCAGKCLSYFQQSVQFVKFLTERVMYTYKIKN